MARRKGAEWYVAVLDCRAEERTLELDLSGLNLSGQELTLYRDGPASPGCQYPPNRRKAAADRQATVACAGGGFIIHARPPRTFAGWK